MMRALAIAAAIALGGCQVLLGIDDPVGDQCDPFDDGACDPGESCDVVFDTGLLDCRTAGVLTAHEPCEFAEECAGGFTCLRGMCRTICNESFDCNGDAGELECIVDISGIRVCDSNCDVTGALSGGCPGGFECEILHNYDGDLTPLCTRPDDGDAFALDQECYDLDQCVATLACYDENGDSDGQQIGRCTELCKVADGGGPCPGECIQLWTPVHGTAVGVCPLP